MVTRLFYVSHTADLSDGATFFFFGSLYFGFWRRPNFYSQGGTRWHQSET